MAGRTVRLGIVGCGAFGQELARITAGLEDLDVVAVCDSDVGRSRTLANRLGVKAYTSLSEMLRDSPATAVALCTPNDQHCSEAIAAASAGKHVFCEKPMARSVSECAAMIAAAEKSGVCLMVGHMQRLRPEYATMAQVVHSGSLGRLCMASIEGFFYRVPTGWWASEGIGGGLLAFVAVHDIDFLNYIGGEVGSVYAAAPPKTDERTDYIDAIGVVMVFRSGAVANLTSSWRFPPLDLHDSRAVRLVLEGGSIYYDPPANAVEVRTFGGGVQRKQFDRATSFDHAYGTELANFAGWINGESPPLLTGLDGLRCVAVIEAADRSVATGLPVSPATIP